jgi:hypothetical protein
MNTFFSKKMIVAVGAFAMVGALGVTANAQSSALRTGAPVTNGVALRSSAVGAMGEMASYPGADWLRKILESQQSLSNSTVSSLSTSDRESLFDAR